jgi:hypothetical protein
VVTSLRQSPCTGRIGLKNLERDAQTTVQKSVAGPKREAQTGLPSSSSRTGRHLISMLHVSRLHIKCQPPFLGVRSTPVPDLILTMNTLLNDDASSTISLRPMPQRLEVIVPGDDWTGVISSARRRRLQNRLNQRAYSRCLHLERQSVEIDN